MNRSAAQTMTEIKKFKGSHSSKTIEYVSKLSSDIKFEAREIVEIMSQIMADSDKAKVVELLQNNLKPYTAEDIHSMISATKFSDDQLRVFKAVYRSLNDKSKQSQEKILSAFTFMKEKKEAQTLLSTL